MGICQTLDPKLCLNFATIPLPSFHQTQISQIIVSSPRLHCACSHPRLAWCSSSTLRLVSQDIHLLIRCQKIPAQLLRLRSIADPKVFCLSRFFAACGIKKGLSGLVVENEKERKRAPSCESAFSCGTFKLCNENCL
jgi:hypothetical protein